MEKKSKKSKKILYGVGIVILIFISIVVTVTYVLKNIDIYKYKKTVSQENFIAHALGGIEGNQYTNSKEALENSYSKGIKLFEVDIRFTSEKKLVCVHGWSKKDYTEKLGLEYDEDNMVMSYDVFMNSKIKGKYTTIDFKELVSFMKQHNDMYVMIDIGNQDYENTKEIYTEIVNECNHDSKILNMFIVGGHTTNMIKAIQDTYDFKIYNLYWANSNSKKDEEIDTKEEFLQYCKDNKILSLSTSVDTYSKEEETIKYFKENGLIVYVFTENNVEEAIRILENVDVVGTDYIYY